MYLLKHNGIFYNTSSTISARKLVFAMVQWFWGVKRNLWRPKTVPSPKSYHQNRFTIFRVRAVPLGESMQAGALRPPKVVACTLEGWGTFF